ncbi:hypothetical protein IW261DRAFT_1464188 [Armillaria novae-zelandiae]|uniref:Secreted protein n=1 Tax=Armillaria novae-zelandiae TaxID=153914 RepID=A0AA39UI43_9AGAR|nr:hypothetical protein IW261DRAFT_1464188 [Armillaria novae-zelandiae]
MLVLFLFFLRGCICHFQEAFSVFRKVILVVDNIKQVDTVMYFQDVSDNGSFHRSCEWLSQCRQHYHFFQNSPSLTRNVTT